MNHPYTHTNTQRGHFFCLAGKLSLTQSVIMQSFRVDSIHTVVYFASNLFRNIKYHWINSRFQWMTWVQPSTSLNEFIWGSQGVTSQPCFIQYSHSSIGLYYWNTNTVLMMVSFANPRFSALTRLLMTLVIDYISPRAINMWKWSYFTILCFVNL